MASDQLDEASSYLRHDVPDAFDHASSAGMVLSERLSAQFSRGLHAAADYLRQIDVNEQKAKASTLIRRYPLQAMGLGIVGGFILSRKLSR